MSLQLLTLGLFLLPLPTNKGVAVVLNQRPLALYGTTDHGIITGYHERKVYQRSLRVSNRLRPQTAVATSGEIPTENFTDMLGALALRV